MKIIALIVALSARAAAPGWSNVDPASVGTPEKPPKCGLPKGLIRSTVGIPMVVCRSCDKGQGVTANGYCGGCPSGQGVLSTAACGACASGEGVLSSGACGRCPDKWTVGAGAKCTAPPPPPLTEAEKQAKAKADALAAKRANCESNQSCHGGRIAPGFKACVDACMAQ